MTVPKTLFLTPTAISKDYSVGMFMQSMCRYFPQEALDCFAMLSQVYVPNEFSSEMDWMPREILKVPDQFCIPPRQRNDWLGVKSLLHWSSILEELDQIADRIAEHARERKTELLWVQAGGPFVIATALRVVRKTGIPAAVVVLDPPQFLMNIFGFSKVVQDAVMAEFAELLGGARSCAVASEAMKRDLEKKYGVPCYVFYLPIEKFASRAQTVVDKQKPLTIGFGGYMQFPENLGALVNALNHADWKVAGREIKIKMYSVGHQSPVPASKPENLEYCEYVKGEGVEVLKLFADIDIGYLPFWLTPLPEQDLAVKFCFPTKLSLYVSAGCPVLFHGPEYCSAAEFLERYPFGTRCSSSEPAEIIAKLEELIENRDLASRLPGARTEALEQIYSPVVHRDRFADYIGATDNQLMPIKAQEAISFG